MAVRLSPCETQVLPTVLVQVRVRARALFRCNNAHRLLLVHNQPQYNKEAAHPQAMFLQGISRLVKVHLLQDMARPAMAHLPKVARQ